MVQWMHCMADKAHKQEVYAMHTYSDMHSITWWPYSTTISIHIISSSKLVSTNWRATAIYVYRDGCWIMWPCYGVHISLCAWHFLIVCVLFQPCSAFIDGAIPISDRFLFGNLFMETCFCSFLVNVDIDTFQSISSEEVCKKNLTKQHTLIKTRSLNSDTYYLRLMHHHLHPLFFFYTSNPLQTSCPPDFGICCCNLGPCFSY